MKHFSVRMLPGVVLVLCGGVIGAQGQAPAQLPRFEVASVKENVSGETRAREQTLPGGRLVAANVLLKGQIADAFLGAQPLGLARVIGGPAWIETARYDINATSSLDFKPSPDGPPKELFQMIRSLLEDRFKLKAHVETRELPI